MEDAGGDTRDQIRGSTLLLAGQAFSVLVNLAVQLLIVRHLAVSSYGAFAYALSVAGIGQTFAAFGLRHGVSRFMPIFEERGDHAQAAGTLAFALATVASLGTVIALGVVAFRDSIAGGVGGQEAVALLTIMIALAPLLALGTVLDGAFAVFARPRAIVFRRFVLVPILRLVVVGVLIATDSGPLFLAWGYLAVEVVGLVVYGPMLVPLLRNRGLLAHLRPSRLELPIRAVVKFVAPLFTNDLAAATLNFASAIVVGALVGAQEVASLRAVFPLALTMGYVYTSFGTLFIPIASRLYARGDATELNRLYWQTATWTTVLAYPIFAATVILAEPLTELLFGQRYESSAPILAVLALGQFINTAAGHNGVLLGVFGRVRLIVITNLIAVAVNLGLMFLLVPAHGALGAAIAITIAYVVMNGLRQVWLVRRTWIRSIEPSYLLALSVTVGTTAVALGIELGFATSTPIAVGLTCLAMAAVFVAIHPHLRLRDTFPEIARVPLVRMLARSGRDRE